ncbi:nuclear transport factor 2 family protein [Leptobacterium sp. I13]|uniref:nuclear transport factor 2 family protein n=1 Tax=Leptobacterium meishanense TaxID=3128904 RepID=UPI0030EEB8DF
MKKYISLFLFVTVPVLIFGQAPSGDKKQISEILNTWHKAAAEADYKTYFENMTADVVFIGTDATENWQNDAFRAFAKPYFDNGKAWSFIPVERNIYVDNSTSIAWFDELLDTQMKICRGSGVLKKENGKWKIAHYVLSITIPNENVSEVITIKKAFDDALIDKLQDKKN